MMRPFTSPLHFLRAFVSCINQCINVRFSHLTRIRFVGLLPCVIIDNSTVVFCHCWRPCDTLRPSPTPCVKGQIAHAASHRDSCSHRDRPRGHLSRSL